MTMKGELRIASWSVRVETKKAEEIFNDTEIGVKSESDLDSDLEQDLGCIESWYE